MTQKSDTRKISNRPMSVVFALVCVLSLIAWAAVPAAALADEAEQVKVSIPFSLELTETAAEQSKDYTFTMTPGDGAPVPEGVKTEITMTEAGDEAFGELVFTEEGKYVYTIRQTTEEEDGFDLDDSVYKVTIAVGPTDEEDLALLYMLVGKVGQSEKPEKICFRNDYAEDEASPGKTPPSDKEKQTGGTEKPKQKPVPKETRTGDYVKLALPFIALAGAAAIMIWLIVTRRKREQQ